MNKNSIILPIILSSVFSISLNAQDFQEGYLNSDNLVSVFVSDLAKKIATQLTESEKRQLEQFQKEINQQLLSADGLTQTVYFRTADHNLDDRALNYLNNVILSLHNYSDLSYTLYGYADARGNSEYNSDLSQSRINAIKSVLVDLGINLDNISQVNYGDSLSKEYDYFEDYFYDRKVEINIKLKDLD